VCWGGGEVGDKKVKENNFFNKSNKNKEEIDDLFCCCFWQIYNAIKICPAII
jgi:hypothetical protein